MDQSKGNIPDNTENWPAVFSISLAMFGLVAAELLPISVLTPMANDLNVSISAAGQMVTVTAAVAALASPIVILGSRRLDRRNVILALTGLLVISSILTATTSNYWVILFTRSILGFALGGTWAMMTALVLRLVPPNMVPRAMSIVFAGVSLASVIAPAASAYLGDIWGWRGTLVAAAVVGLIALFAQLATLPKLPAVQSSSLSSFWKAATRGTVLAGIITTLLVVSGHFAGFTYMRPLLEQVVGFDISTISLILFAFGIGGVVGNLIGGALAARNAALCAGVSGIILVIAVACLVFMGGGAVTAFLAPTIWGFAFGAFPVAISTWNAQAAPDHAESAGALLASSFQVAVAAGASIGGAAVGGYGPKGAVVYTCAAVLSGAIIIFVSWYRTKPQRVTEIALEESRRGNAPGGRF